MSNETPTGSAGEADGGGHSGGSRGESAPLQSRAKFLQNWDWSSVTQINGGLCERGHAQRGINSETHRAAAIEWELRRNQTLTLLETYRFLKSCHRRAPFLFFNGNTFAEIGRAITVALFADLPPLRRKEVASAVAHFVTGVLAEEQMVSIVESLARTAEFKASDRVKTLRGSLRGVIVSVLEDGRVIWRPDGTENELTCLPESLLEAD